MAGYLVNGQCFAQASDAAAHFASSQSLSGFYDGGTYYSCGYRVESVGPSSFEVARHCTAGPVAAAPAHAGLIVVPLPDCADPYSPEALDLLGVSPAAITASFLWGFGVVVALWFVAYCIRAGREAVRIV